MKLPRWEEFQENVSFWDEMDPLYESALARALRGWPEESEIHTIPEKDPEEIVSGQDVYINVTRAMVFTASKTSLVKE